LDRRLFDDDKSSQEAGSDDKDPAEPNLEDKIKAFLSIRLFDDDKSPEEVGSDDKDPAELKDENQIISAFIPSYDIISLLLLASIKRCLSTSLIFVPNFLIILYVFSVSLRTEKSESLSSLSTSCDDLSSSKRRALKRALI
jgi:hypothetical protein